MVFDYIIVGGGTAGSVLASRLTERPGTTVLLLEAGPANPRTAPPLLWQTLLGSDADWADRTVEQSSTGASLPVSRGRGLGGSSAINGLSHVRGHRAGYDRWAAEGATGWGFDDLLPFFRRSETTEGRDAALRGTAGPMRVAPIPEPDDVTFAWIDAGVELGHPQAADISSGVEAGFGLWDQNVVDGVRQTAADAYLRPHQSRTNLTVVTDAVAQRLLLDGGTCTGVEYRHRGEVVTAHAGAEVILTAGTFGSAHLLLLSGIGPAGHLREAGVPVRHDLPGVGENLHDHTLAGVVYRSARPVSQSTRNASGEAIGLVHATPGSAAPDLQTLILTVPLHVPGLPVPDNGFTIAFSAMAPRSRGTLRLASADPHARPLIDPGYYADPADVEAMADGLRLARRLGAAGALKDWGPEEIFPGPDVDEDRIDSVRPYLFRGLQSYQHLVGTCRIGVDDHAVVGPDLRVHGIGNLRVADASVIPAVPSANTNATVLAIAERAATLISG
ncbi:GMC family oxidoreductase [Catenuloplanes japonicus]|uniref:GMC family oxidoreductase n=1 Tax=Catenuloplanes japonicus TaxID=33876 RepID=UPI000524217D|nr:GMC family oxidoreductase N-terminal domain-containing protein [Catenuloplanes japonicus]